MLAAQTKHIRLKTSLSSNCLALATPQILGRGGLQHVQQRTSRFGFWSSYLDPDYQKEVQRRDRQLRKKYAEALNRRLSWDRQASNHFRKHSHHHNHHDLEGKGTTSSKKPSMSNKCSDPFEQTEQLRHDGTVHIEQNPMDQIFKSHNDMVAKIINVQSRIFGSIFPESIEQPPKQTKAPSSTMNTIKKTVAQTLNPSSSNDTPYTIDPITNRRVYPAQEISNNGLHTTATGIPTTTLESWLTPSGSLNPFASDPTRACLKEYETHGHEDYKPVYYREPDGKPPNQPVKEDGLKEYDAKAPYGPLYHNEPDGYPVVSSIDPDACLKDYDNSHAYGPVMYREPDGYPVLDTTDPDACLKDFDNSHAYGPVMYREPDGKPLDSTDLVKTGLEEFDQKAHFSGPPPQSPGSGVSSKKLRYEITEDKREDLDLLRDTDVLAASGLHRGQRKETTAEKISTREKLEQDFYKTQKDAVDDLRIEHSELLNRIAHAKGRVDAKIAEVDISLPSLSERKFTGNFVRDFPEEFTTSWKTDSSGTSTLVNDSAAKSSITTPLRKYVSTTVPKDGQLQTSLDRNNAAAAGLSPSSVQNLRSTTKADKQKHKELVRELRQIYEDAYGTLDSKHRAVSHSATVPTTTAASDQPVLYKVLAYDPTMQSISEAETTSIVTDSATPLTPAEVLLRLSNPAKFFPHFAPLQAKGYEILTGGGDVLVFRKVRDGPLKSTISTSRKSSATIGPNPIDGMRPVAPTGNFASPTGFVNYDAIGTEPPFKSNVDVRREESVFSGKRNWQEEGSTKKRSGRVKKILVSGVTVGACAYAVGVVAEFFKTGGAEGFPKGF